MTYYNHSNKLIYCVFDLTFTTFPHFQTNSSIPPRGIRKKPCVEKYVHKVFEVLFIFKCYQSHLPVVRNVVTERREQKHFLLKLL